MLNGLDLFSGIGGIAEAVAPWVRTVAYCENERYAQAVLLSRMERGEIDTAPIWDDVTTLRGDMLPKIDIIYGGFPCQDISTAGRGTGLAGQRSGLFYEIVRLCREIRPGFVFLENVPAITFRGLNAVTGALAELRYDCRWGLLSAHDMGAPHRRERWWCLAYAEGARYSREHTKLCKENGRQNGQVRREFGRAGIKSYDLANANDERTIRQEKNRDIRQDREAIFANRVQATERIIIVGNGSRENVANPTECGRREGDEDAGRPRKGKGEAKERRGFTDSSKDLADTDKAGRREQRRAEPTKKAHGTIECGGGDRWSSAFWSTEPAVGRVVNGLPYRNDRLKCLGNSVVPQQAREAFKRLMGLTASDGKE